jgi:hypothetical protein
VVVSTFQLELENSVDYSLPLVRDREFRELYIPLGWSLRIGGWSLLPIVDGELGSWCFQ